MTRSDNLIKILNLGGRLFLGAVVLVLSGCGIDQSGAPGPAPKNPAETPPGIQDKPIGPTGDMRSKKTQEECETAGGLWEVAGISGEYRCFTRYSDGGKPCNRSLDCQGECIYDKERKGGFCKASNYPYGCRSSYENGKVLPELCAD